MAGAATSTKAVRCVEICGQLHVEASFVIWAGSTQAESHMWEVGSAWQPPWPQRESSAGAIEAPREAGGVGGAPEAPPSRRRGRRAVRFREGGARPAATLGARRDIGRRRRDIGRRRRDIGQKRPLAADRGADEGVARLLGGRWRYNHRRRWEAVPLRAPPERRRRRALATRRSLTLVDGVKGDRRARASSRCAVPLEAAPPRRRA